jgi:predicted dehydrogenase
MLYFFGLPAEATGLSYNASRLYDADDTTTGQIRFQNGVLLNGAWCFTVPEKRDHCEIIGSEGTLQFSIFDHRLLILKTEESEVRFTFEPLPHVQQPMIQKVTEYFLDQAENPCSADDGVEVMKMMEAFTKR